jgi:hypothetical protein
VTGPLATVRLVAVDPRPADRTPRHTVLAIPRLPGEFH